MEKANATKRRQKEERKAEPGLFSGSAPDLMRLARKKKKKSHTGEFRSRENRRARRLPGPVCVCVCQVDEIRRSVVEWKPRQDLNILAPPPCSLALVLPWNKNPAPKTPDMFDCVRCLPALLLLLQSRAVFQPAASSSSHRRSRRRQNASSPPRKTQASDMSSIISLNDAAPIRLLSPFTQTSGEGERACECVCVCVCVCVGFRLSGSAGNNSTC